MIASQVAFGIRIRVPALITRSFAGLNGSHKVSVVEYRYLVYLWYHLPLILFLFLLMVASSAAAATCLCERTRYQKQASTVRKRYSVPKTAFSGTRRIFKGPQNSRLHRLWTASCRTGRIFSARNGPRSEVSRHKKRVTSKPIKTFWSFPQRPYCCRRMRILRRRCLLQKKIKKRMYSLEKS